MISLPTPTANIVIPWVRASILASACRNVRFRWLQFSETIVLYINAEHHIYHIILRFAVSHHHSDAVLDLDGSLSWLEHMVHSELDGPSSLRKNAVMVWVNDGSSASRFSWLWYCESPFLSWNPVRKSVWTVVWRKPTWKVVWFAFQKQEKAVWRSERHLTCVFPPR